MGEAIDASSTDVFVSWLPLYHDMGLIGAWLGSLYFAAPLYVMSPLSFLTRPANWLWAIHRFRATLSAAPNFGFELCVNKIDEASLEGLDLGSLRMVANGAEPVSVYTLRRFTRKIRAAMDLGAKRWRRFMGLPRTQSASPFRRPAARRDRSQSIAMR